MPRQAHVLTLPDVAAFTRALGLALRERQGQKPEPPGHVELLNLVARAAGWRSFQALKAAAAAPAAAPAACSTRSSGTRPEPELSDNARKALQFFDGQGVLTRWPVKFSVQKLAMWVLWTRFDAKRMYTEREVNTILKAANGFGDHVTLRRELINHRLMARTSDCSEYRKLPARPDPETRALLTAWRARYKAD